MSKRILIITRHYLDENNGGSNCSKANIRALSEIFSDCTLIYPEHSDRSSMPFVPEGVRAIPCYDHRNKIQKGLSVYCGILHRAPKFVTKQLERNNYDLVVLDHSLTANGVIDNVKKHGCKIVTIHHNNESQYIRDNKPGLLYRWPFVYYSEKAERDALLMSDLNITLTEKDARGFHDLYSNRDIHCHNMGTFQYQDLPKNIQDNDIANCKIFAMTGSMNFQQSQRPVLEFIEKFYPVLLRKIPKARLIIAGRNPSIKIQEACKRYKQITLIPNPDDISAVISKADIYVCPINTGSGVKLRVMDGLKLGIPILGHSVSLNGYESIKKDGFFFDYYNENTFENALEDIINLKYKKQQVYDSFLTYFSFEAGKSRLQEILKKENII